MSIEERLSKIEVALAGRPFYDDAQPKIDANAMTIEDRLGVLEQSMARFERLLERSSALRSLLGNETPGKY